MEDKPRFYNEGEFCPSCTFMGGFEYQGRHYDLWMHWGNFEQTAIARFGEDGDYISGLPAAWKNPPQAECVLRALQQQVIYAMQLRCKFSPEVHNLTTGQTLKFPDDCYPPLREYLENCPIPMQSFTHGQHESLSISWGAEESEN